VHRLHSRPAPAPPSPPAANSTSCAIRRHLHHKSLTAECWLLHACYTRTTYLLCAATVHRLRSQSAPASPNGQLSCMSNSLYYCTTAALPHWSLAADAAAAAACMLHAHYLLCAATVHTTVLSPRPPAPASPNGQLSRMLSTYMSHYIHLLSVRLRLHHTTVARRRMALLPQLHACYTRTACSVLLLCTRLNSQSAPASPNGQLSRMSNTFDYCTTVAPPRWSLAADAADTA
jgi:hypothetical protein